MYLLFHVSEPQARHATETCVSELDGRGPNRAMTPLWSLSIHRMRDRRLAHSDPPEGTAEQLLATIPQEALHGRETGGQGVTAFHFQRKVQGPVNLSILI